MQLNDLNPPQRQAVEQADGPLLILAGAGSGKTRVLTHRLAYLIATGRARPQEILAVTFTNKAAREMRERVERLVGAIAGMWITTFHSAGLRLLREQAPAIELPRDFVVYDDDDQMKLLRQILESLNLDDKKFPARSFLNQIARAKDQVLSPADVAAHAKETYGERLAQVYTLYEAALRRARAVDFADLIALPVRMFRAHPELLARYQSRFRYLLIDEYQDTNHSQYELVRLLSAAHDNVCVVGDPDQCLPAGTPIRTPQGWQPIERLRAGDAVLVGHGGGRVTTAKIQKVMSRPYTGTLCRIRLHSGAVIQATPNHLCFGRLEPRPGMHYVYLMWKRGIGYRIGTTSGIRTSKDGVLLNGIQVRTNQEVADAMWILRASPDLGEIRMYEQLYSVRYGIPTMVFFVRGRRLAVRQQHIDQLFAAVDTESAAQRLMSDLDLDPRYPHHRPYAVIRGAIHRQYVWFTMFGDGRTYDSGRWHDHRIQLVTSDPKLKKLAATRFPVRTGKKGTWRIETSRKDYEAGHALASDIAALGDLAVVSRARLTSGKAFYFLPASHLQPGMVVPVLQGHQVVEDTVESVESVSYTGKVYDLSIPHMRNYVAAGMVVHNSVYRWRGADIRNILSFEQDYPQAAVIRLEQNYRSTKTILQAANAVIGHNSQRRPKDLWTDNAVGAPIVVRAHATDLDEAGWVTRQIAKARSNGARYHDVAIFYRTNAQSRPYEEAMRYTGIPYKIYGGVGFYERKEVKDLLAYLRLLVNPHDGIGIARVINTPPRGIGKTTLDRLTDEAARTARSLYDVMGDGEVLRILNAGTRERVMTFRRLIDELRAEVPTCSLAELWEQLIQRSGYIEWLHEGDDDATAERVAHLEELGRALAESAYDPTVEATPLQQFLDQVSLVSDVDGLENEGGAVHCMTLHLAKGLEFPIVFVVGMEEGLFPHARSFDDPDELEEERRLCYVGMTRAREQLYLCHAERRRLYGREQYNVPSRFLEELPEGAVTSDSKRVTGDSWLVAGARTASHQSRIRHQPHSGVEGEAPSGFAGGGGDVSPCYDQRSPEEQAATLRIGTHVMHPLFGSGVIRKIEGQGAAQKVMVQFDRAGLKTLMVQYANLQIVG
ncbi:MAG: UvrD-helicase domain-containing protein [Deltaproteobacteria bacterium]|nr:UvrD-helicase domain-containing protein [Deltaproteobacteria bacterium]